MRKVHACHFSILRSTKPRIAENLIVAARRQVLRSWRILLSIFVAKNSLIEATKEI